MHTLELRNVNSGYMGKPVLHDMDSYERRKISINKSTLWYMQKHIKEGKKIKVYGKVVDKIK